MVSSPTRKPTVDSTTPGRPPKKPYKHSTLTEQPCDAQGCKRLISPPTPFSELLMKVGELCVGTFLRLPADEWEWKSEYLLGRAMARLGRPVGEVMGHLWRGLEKCDEGGNVAHEAFYALHSARW